MKNSKIKIGFGKNIKHFFIFIISLQNFSIYELKMRTKKMIKNENRDMLTTQTEIERRSLKTVQNLWKEEAKNHIAAYVCTDIQKSEKINIINSNKKRKWERTKAFARYKTRDRKKTNN